MELTKDALLKGIGTELLPTLGTVAELRICIQFTMCLESLLLKPAAKEN